MSGYTVSKDSCSCMFFKTMNLPCKHIFKVLAMTGCEMFVPSLCSIRWTKNYYYKSHPALSAYEQIPAPKPLSIRQIRIPEEIEKYKKTAVVSKELNNLASAMSNSQYNYFMDKMYALKNEMIHPNIHVASINNNSVELPSNHDTSTNNDAIPDPLCVPSLSHIRSSSHSDNSVNEKISQIAQQLNQSGQSDNATKDRALLATVQLPTKIVSIGRPKGSGLTVIGTKRKIQQKENTQAPINKKMKFTDLDENEKALQIVGWLTNLQRNAILKKKISLDNLIHDQRIFNRLRDSEVQLSDIKKLVDAKCFKYLSKEVETMQKSEFWPCAKCMKNLKGMQVKCCACLDWFHIKCSTRASSSKSSQVHYFCSFCV